MHFCRRHGLQLDPELRLDGAVKLVVDEIKFLGLVLDKRLSFVQHINYLKQMCLKALNQLEVVVHTDLGSGQCNSVQLYGSHVRSKLDYGCIVNDSARGSYLKSLNRVQNAAFRVCLGAFKTSPIPSLHVEANELPLALCRQKLTLHYTTKLELRPFNTAYSCVLFPGCKVFSTPGQRLSQLLAFECCLSGAKRTSTVTT